MTYYLYNLIFIIIFAICFRFSHEIGHYVSGRMAGIPKERIKINFSIPFRIALKNHEGKWVTPDNFKEFVKTYNSFNINTYFTYFYLAGGMIGETDFLLITFLLIYFTPINNQMIFLLIFLSILIDVIYVIADTVQNFKQKIPPGDISNMWLISTSKTTLYLIFHFSIRLGLLYVYLNIIKIY